MMKTLKRVLYCSCAVLAVCLSAHAADLPNKNAPVTAAYPSAAGTGGYIGLGSFAALSTSTVTATDGTSTNLNSAGAAIELIGGWQYKLFGSRTGFTEIGVNYTGVGGSSNCMTTGGTIACNVSNPWGFTIGTAIDADWTQAFRWIPIVASVFNGNSPSNLLPAGLTPTASIPYMGIWGNVKNENVNINGVATSRWIGKPEVRIGLTNYLPQSGMVAKTWVGWSPANTGITVGGARANDGSELRAGLDLAF